MATNPTATLIIENGLPDHAPIVLDRPVAEQAQIDASVVTGGMYSIMTNQLSSGSHNGKAVSFRTGDRVAGQSQVWTSGRADELNLTWGGPLLLGFDHGICC
jgi:hypothetical protein